MQLLNLFYSMTLLQASAWLLVENILLFILALAFGHLLLFLFKNRRVVEKPLPVQLSEIAWAISCILLNTVVTIAGWFLWKIGIIRIHAGPVWRIPIDVVVLLIAMDLMMYLSHRIAHLKWFYPWVHHTHHLYDKPRPLNLFVLNPFEVLGFGALWLAVLIVYPATWYGILIYLALNLLFGTVGHLGVEPCPQGWTQFPLLKHLGTSTFHARHHQDRNVNYGFYTDIWDRLFHTLHKKYLETFGRLDG